MKGTEIMLGHRWTRVKIEMVLLYLEISQEFRNKKTARKEKGKS